MGQQRAFSMAGSGAGLPRPARQGAGRVRSENARLRAQLDAAHAVAQRYEMMLREGDHRIKNSLQIVASLMTLQARREESPTASLALMGAVARIQSVARIHDALQDTIGEDAVDLGDVIATMCAALQAMAGDPLAVTVVVDAPPFQAPVALAQPIALAVNELVVNALRHAFPEGRAGTVRIAVGLAGERLRVTVIDDGVGLPPGYAEGHGYGLTLVRAMASQIGGALLVESAGGARFTLTAPAPAVVR